jgi:hypothetical protein
MDGTPVLGTSKKLGGGDERGDLEVRLRRACVLFKTAP